MAKNTKTWIIVILLVAGALFVGGMYTQKQYPIFSLMSPGAYRSDATCSFITNVAVGSTYKDSNGWVSVNDGSGMKAFGENGYSSYSCTDSAATIVGHTIEGYNICTRSGYSNRVYVQEGTNGVIFTTTSGNTAGAVTSCGTPPTCTESWTCTAWSACSSGTQTRTCSDSNSCGTTTSKPAVTQTCGTSGSCLLTDTNANGKVDDSELLQAINRWVNNG